MLPYAQFGTNFTSALDGPAYIRRLSSHNGNSLVEMRGSPSPSAAYDVKTGTTTSKAGQDDDQRHHSRASPDRR